MLPISLRLFLLLFPGLFLLHILHDLSILGLIKEIGQVLVIQCGVPGNGDEVSIEIEVMARQ